MGRVYVNDRLVPAIHVLAEAYREGRLSVGSILTMIDECLIQQPAGDGTMPYGENEERENEESAPSLHSPSKEEREKEEMESAVIFSSGKNPKKSFFSRPSAEEVLAYHEELGITEFEAHEFYDYYEGYGWKSKIGVPVADWKALMRCWVRRNNQKLKSFDKDNGKTNHTEADSAAAAKDRRSKLQEWLDENYPLPAEGDPAFTTERLACIKGFMEKYSVDRQDDFATERALEGVGQLKYISHMEEMMTLAPVMHVLIWHLDDLADDLGALKRNRQPRTLEKIALRLLSKYGHYKFPELMLAFNLFRRGKFDSFGGRLAVSRMMRSMERYDEWRRKTRHQANRYQVLG